MVCNGEEAGSVGFGVTLELVGVHDLEHSGDS